MKILFLAAANSTHTAKWVNTLAERGHDIYLVYNVGHEPKYDKINGKIKQYPLKYGGVKGYYFNSLQLRRLTNKIKPDVVNVHYASGYGTLARRAKLDNVLLSVWGSDVYEFPYKNLINKYILQKNVLYAKRVASTSMCMAEQLRKVLERPYMDISITPFGVNLEWFTPTQRRSRNSEKIIIGNVKSLEKIYGIDVLIKVAFYLKNERGLNNFQVHIYGDGSLKEELQQLIERLEMEEIVFLKGKIPNTEVPKVLQEFDIFCATSENESFGVAVLEAMAMELPVVATDAEGFKEVVVDNETGFIVKKKSIQEIAQKLERLIRNRELRSDFGKKGREHVKMLYDWEKNVSAMEKIYEELKETI